LLCSGHEMNEVSEPIAGWLEQKRRTDRASAALISVLALGSGTVVFLLTTLVVYTLLSLFSGTSFHSDLRVWVIALGATVGIFVLSMKVRQDEGQLRLDPMGYWVFKDIFSVGPRLILEGLRQVRCCGLLGELNVAACTQALSYLAVQNTAVTWQDLMQHCPPMPGPRLREQLSLLDGVLFLGEDAPRVTLMDPFRLRLRWMLDQNRKSGKWHEPPQPKPEPTSQAVPVNEPEKLSAYEILGLSPLASAAQIKIAYRKRVKECHPDLFAGMDQQASAMAERWTRALNAAYATLNPKRGDSSPTSTTGQR